VIDSYLELAVAMLIVAPLNLKPAVVPELSLPKTAGASYEDDKMLLLRMERKLEESWSFRIAPYLMIF